MPRNSRSFSASSSPLSPLVRIASCDTHAGRGGGMGGRGLTDALLSFAEPQSAHTCQPTATTGRYRRLFENSRERPQNQTCTLTGIMRHRPRDANLECAPPPSRSTRPEAAHNLSLRLKRMAATNCVKRNHSLTRECMHLKGQTNKASSCVRGRVLPLPARSRRKRSIFHIFFLPDARESECN